MRSLFRPPRRTHASDVPAVQPVAALLNGHPYVYAWLECEQINHIVHPAFSEALPFRLGQMPNVGAKCSELVTELGQPNYFAISAFEPVVKALVT